MKTITETLLIADDEKNIRDGLKCILDWKSLGFTLCGEAANGEEALSCILKNNPSLVLLDIRMPKLTGIDIIRIAREQGYNGRFIILSGYSDFSYAQAAIRYGVECYLTKPIDEDELLDAIHTIKESLMQEHRASDNIPFGAHVHKKQQTRNAYCFSKRYQLLAVVNATFSAIISVSICSASAIPVFSSSFIMLS